ncbi:MAG TPA: hypothetical protein VFL79_02550 [Terriglobia bacterium]|nr:hypothetical protein [Terriglobia bacterium]
MKTDRTALFWGTVIGFGFVVGVVVKVFEFPHARMPFPFPFLSSHGLVIAVDAVVAWALVASYRKLWGKPGFWALVLAFLAANSLFFGYLAEQIAGPQRFLIYGAIGGGEFCIFAVIVLRLYRIGPDTRAWTGHKER